MIASEITGTPFINDGVRDGYAHVVQPSIVDRVRQLVTQRAHIDAQLEEIRAACLTVGTFQTKPQRALALEQVVLDELASGGTRDIKLLRKLVGGYKTRADQVCGRMVQRGLIKRVAIGLYEAA